MLSPMEELRVGYIFHDSNKNLSLLYSLNTANLTECDTATQNMCSSSYTELKTKAWCPQNMINQWG